MSDAFLFGPYRLYPQSRLLQRSQVEVSLGGRAFDMLAAMVERSGQVLSHRELMTIGWPNVIVEESSIRVQIAMLRRKLGCGRDGTRYIASVAGRGYCFVARTQRVQADEAPGSRSVEGLSTLPDAHGHQPPVSPPSRLPAPHERALGREENVSELSRMIMAHRFVTVLGPGGVGKTTLAILVAHSLEHFAEVVRFIDLSSVEDSTLVADAIACAVDLKSVDGDPLQNLLTLSAHQRTLIVLDNCEHVIATVASLAESLIRETQNIYLLATSREALRVRGEFIYLLRPLGAPPHTGRLTAKQAMAWPAVQLFMERAADGGHQDSLTDEQAATVAAICRRLDGNPLGIELIASRVATYGIQGVAELLGNQMVLSWRGRRDAAPRHQTVEAMLDWSHNLLTERERRVLRGLSIFIGRFSLEAAISVVADEEIGVADLLASISDLVDKSLIVASSTDGHTALRLLDTTRTYAGLKLAATPDCAAISRKHAAYYASELRKYAHANVSAGSGYLRPDTGDIGNVRAALEWCFAEDGDMPLALELCALAIPLFLDLSLLSECSRWCRRALLGLGESARGTADELTLQKALAISSHFVSDNVEDFKSVVEASLELGKELGNKRHQFHLQAGLHLAMVRDGEFRQAMTVAKQYAADASASGGPLENVMAKWMLGTSFHILGNQAEAIDSYTSGFDLAIEQSLRPKEYFEVNYRLIANVGRARAAWIHGFPNQALRLTNQALDDARNHPVSLCICLSLGVPVYFLSGLLDRAEGLVHELNGLTARYALGAYHQAGVAFRGQLLLLRGDTSTALAHLRKSATTLNSLGFHIVGLDVSRAFAEGLSARGEHNEAILEIENALDLAERSGCTLTLPELLRTKAEILRARTQTDWQTVRELLLQAISFARKQAALSWELRAALALTRVAIPDREHEDEAMDMLSDVYGRFTEGFETADLTAAAHTLRGSSRGLKNAGFLKMPLRA